MSVITTTVALLRRPDWRIWFGLIVTFFWLSGSIRFVIASVRAHSEQGLSLDTAGSLLEGAFAPLAFMWLVPGLFIQQRHD